MQCIDTILDLPLGSTQRRLVYVTIMYIQILAQESVRLLTTVSWRHIRGERGLCEAYVVILLHDLISQSLARRVGKGGFAGWMWARCCGQGFVWIRGRCKCWRGRPGGPGPFKHDSWQRPWDVARAWILPTPRPQPQLRCQARARHAACHLPPWQLPLSGPSAAALAAHGRLNSTASTAQLTKARCLGCEAGPRAFPDPWATCLGHGAWGSGRGRVQGAKSPGPRQTTPAPHAPRRWHCLHPADTRNRGLPFRAPGSAHSHTLGTAACGGAMRGITPTPVP